MEHEEFVEKYKNGEISVSVNRSLALYVVGKSYLPKRYTYAHLFWSWVWFLSIPIGIVLMFIKGFFVGLLTIIGSSVLSSAVKKSAMQFVLEHALDDKEFYKVAIKNNIIVVNEK